MRVKATLGLFTSVCHLCHAFDTSPRRAPTAVGNRPGPKGYCRRSKSALRRRRRATVPRGGSDGVDRSRPCGLERGRALHFPEPLIAITFRDKAPSGDQIHHHLRAYGGFFVLSL